MKAPLRRVAARGPIFYVGCQGTERRNEDDEILTERSLPLQDSAVTRQGKHSLAILVKNRNLTYRCPKTVAVPFGSKACMLLAACSDHGTWAPTIAQARPSRTRCLARMRTCSGMSSSCRSCIHVHRCSVVLAASGPSSLLVPISRRSYATLMGSVTQVF